MRVLQAYAICHKLEEIRREGQHPDPLLICGDFNSNPLSGKCVLAAILLALIYFDTISNVC